MMGARQQSVFKAGIFGACLIPLLVLAWQAVTHHLGANPIEAITDRTGIWTLRLLLITLAVTPARRLTGRIGIQFQIVQAGARIPFTILREEDWQDAMSGHLQGVHNLMAGDHRHLVFDRASTE